MKKHVISSQASLYDALSQMNTQKVKFLIAVDKIGRAVGTLTDGDVRRGLLQGMKLEDPIHIAYSADFTSVKTTDGLAEVLGAFQNPKIEFLPVLDPDGRMTRIITRRGLNVLLLMNQRFSMDFDFSSLDENSLEYEIFARPWGFYKTTVLNDLFQSKVIYVMPGQALSLQSHRRREEYWIVVSGHGTIQLGESLHAAIPGGTWFIPKGCRHRLMNTSETETLILTEVQLGDYFGEDDIERYDDRYGRTPSSQK